MKAIKSSATETTQLDGVCVRACVGLKSATLTQYQCLINDNFNGLICEIVFMWVPTIYVISFDSLDAIKYERLNFCCYLFRRAPCALKQSRRKIKTCIFIVVRKKDAIIYIYKCECVCVRIICALISWLKSATLWLFHG